MATEGECMALEMLNEARAMVVHTLRSGIAVPARIIELIAQAGALSERRDQTAVEGAMPDISRAHGELARLIEPFTPDLIVMLEIESKDAREESHAHHADAGRYAAPLGRR